MIPLEPLFVKLSYLGGADRDRTDDLRLAKPALSQLSYSPGLKDCQSHRSDEQRRTRQFSKEHPLINTLAGHYSMVGLGRVELPTSPLSGVRSNQLSYRPVTHEPVSGSW